MRDSGCAVPDLRVRNAEFGSRNEHATFRAGGPETTDWKPVPSFATHRGRGQAVPSPWNIRPLGDFAVLGLAHNFKGLTYPDLV